MQRIVAIAVLVGIVAAAGAFFFQNGNVHAMSIQINIKDFPEHEVRLIAVSDPSFDMAVEPFFRGQPHMIVDRVKPFSALLENTGSLAIVGSSIRWQILKRDGSTFSVPVSSANPRALMDGGELGTSAGAAIPKGEARFVSILGSAGTGQQVDLSRSWIAFHGTPTEGEDFRRALAQGDIDQAFNRSLIGKVLNEATSCTVSVELVFFEDGTFIGDDTTDFFDRLKANIDAQYDLATEVAIAIKQGKKRDDIFKQVADIVAAHSSKRDDRPAIDIFGGKGTSDGGSMRRRYSDEYDRSKALYAQELLGMRDALGAKEALAQKLQLMDKPRKVLRRR